MNRYLLGLACTAAISGLGLGTLRAAAAAPPATRPAAASAPLAPGESRVTSAPVGKTAGQTRRAGGDPVDDRVEVREYGFQDTGENLPYAVFVSTKVTKDKKAPLVLALHGFSGNYGTFMRTACVDEAEKGGYILVGVMGYSPSGSFGMPFGGGRGGPGRGAPGRGAPANGAAPARGALGPSVDIFLGAAAGPAAGGAPGAGGPGRGGAARGRGAGGRGGPPIGGTKETDSAKVTELSEKDAMYVLAMMCKEFNVDEKRIYLMGHSLGGGGALAMGEKYADKWAAVAALAPAAFGFTWTAESKLKNVPLLIAQGETDTTVQPAGSQRLLDQMKGLGFQAEIKMFPGQDHGGIIAGSQPEVYQFFEKHIKAEKK